MADAIRDTYEIEPTLVGGGGGIFDVKADDRLVFSKHQKGRFPQNDEILDLLGPLVKQ